MVQNGEKRSEFMCDCQRNDFGMGAQEAQLVERATTT